MRDQFAIPSTWSWKPLRELAKIVSGGTPSRDNQAFWNGNIPWVTPTDITRHAGLYLHQTDECITEKGLNSSSANLLPPGSVLMTSRATLGESKIATCHVATNQGFKSLVPVKGVSGLFLLYQMQFFKEKYALRGIGTTFLEVSKKDTENFLVPVPPTFDEQCGIAEMLSALDEQIEATEAAIHKFKMQRKGLTADLLTCRHLPTSEIANVRLAEVIPTVQYGISSSLTEAGAIPVLRMNNLSGGEIDVSDLKYSPADVPSDLYLKPGDVLFNRTNSMEHVGRTSLWRGQLTKCTFASYLVRLSPDSKRLLPEYLVYLLEWEENQLQMRKYATPGVQQVNINPTSLRRCRVKIPKSLDDQRETVAALDAARENIEALREEVAKLKLQKQGFMRDLLTGAVRVTGGH